MQSFFLGARACKDFRDQTFGLDYDLMTLKIWM